MAERSNGRRSTDFKSSFCLRFSSEIGWGLVVYDASNKDEMAWVTSTSSRKILNLGETFIWKARTEENDMILQASIGDGSIHLPILGNSSFRLSDTALKMILDCIASQGAMVSFETDALEEIKKKQCIRRKELMSDVILAEKEFGKRSPQANAARRIALQEMMAMPKDLDVERLEVEIVPKAFSCIEALEMHLDMLEINKEKDCNL